MKMCRVVSLCSLSFLMLLTRANAQSNPSPGGSGGTIVPQITDTNAGHFSAAGEKELVVGRRVMESHFAVARLLKWLNIEPHDVGSSRSTKSRTGVFIGLTSDGARYAALMRQFGDKIPRGPLGDEGYVLNITPESIELTARKPAGIFYGVMELLSLNSAAAPAIKLHAATIVDWPAMRWRGVHVGVGSRADLPLVDELISNYMPALHLNQLILEVDYHFQYKSHPKMDDPSGLTIADCQHLAALAAANNIRIIPMIDCLGHQSWAAHTNRLLREYPQFDESPNVPADNSGIYCRSWCPSDPAVYRVVDDLIGELIDAFHANAFNVGMDEVFILGECPRCKGTPNDVLFARAVNHLYDYIVKKRHVQMMMWGDRLLDGNKTGYGSWEASTNGTAHAIDLIPHDIVICDWHYQLLYNGQKTDYPSVNYFIRKGFKVWPTGWNESDAVAAFEGVSLQAHSPRMMGYLASTWIGLGAVVNGLAGNSDAVSDKGTMDVVNAMRLGAQIAWQGHSGDVSAPVPGHRVTQ